MEHLNSPPQPSLWELFCSFFRLGLTAFGGPSMIAYIRNLSVEKKGWLDADTFDHGVAMCQVIPGATAMQSTAYIGLRTRGVRGAAVSFVGFGLPAFLLMMIFASAYFYTKNVPSVRAAFSGLEAIIVAIVANATFSFGKTTLKSWRHFILAGVAAILFGLNINPILVILMAALGGLIIMRPNQPTSKKSNNQTPIPSTKKAVLFILTVTLGGFILLYLVDRYLFYLSTLFYRIDLFAFGGGFASVPLMYHEVVDVRHWLDAPTFLNGIALGQVTPGPIVITATFIGYLLKGFWGGISATAFIFLPSFTLVIGVAPYFDRLRTSLYFNKIIQGVLCSFVGLLFIVTIRFAMNVSWEVPQILMAIAALIALLIKVDILWVVLTGILISILLFR